MTNSVSFLFTKEILLIVLEYLGRNVRPLLSTCKALYHLKLKKGESHILNKLRSRAKLNIDDYLYSIESLLWAISNTKCPITTKITIGFVKLLPQYNMNISQQKKILDDIICYGHGWNSTVSEIVAGNGSLELLKYIHERDYPIDERASLAAAINGHFRCFEYLRIEYKIFNKEAVTELIKTNNSFFFYRVLQLIITENIHPKLIYNYSALIAAVESDNEEYITSLVRLRTHLNSTVLTHAARHGKLSYVMLLRNAGVQWNPSVVSVAARHGHLECIKYAIKNGCMFENTILIDAAMHSVECLRLVRLLLPNVPWMPEVTLVSIEKGNIDCLKFAIKYHCPLHKDAKAIANELGQNECIEFLEKNKY